MAAAGNSGPDPQTIMSPACEKIVFAAGSARLIPLSPSGYTYSLSSFSSRGPTAEGLVKPDAVFIGEDIEVASSSSDTAVTAKSGTSFSTPFCTGIAALYMEGIIRSIYLTRPEEFGLPAMGSPGFREHIVPMEELLDVWLKRLCVKPQGAPSYKDNGYGEGLPFGPVALKALSGAGAVDWTSILLPVMAMMAMVPVIGMIEGE